MNPNQPGYMPPPPAPPSGGGGLKFPILFGSVLALLGANVYLFTQLDKTKNDVKLLQASLKSEIQEVQQTAAVSTRASKQYVSELKDDLEAARRLERLAREENRQDLMDSARQMRDAADAMRRAAAGGKIGRAHV